MATASTAILRRVLTQRIRVQGFIIFDYYVNRPDLYAAFQQEVGNWLKEGAAIAKTWCRAWKMPRKPSWACCRARTSASWWSSWIESGRLRLLPGQPPATRQRSCCIHKDPSMIPFSVLDLSPINQGSNAAQAFNNSKELAQLAERWASALRLADTTTCPASPAPPPRW
jgi:hypothetical protein